MKTNSASSAGASLAASEENSDIGSDTDFAPYIAALELQKEKMLNADFARKCLTVAIIATTVCLLQTPLTAWLGWEVAHPPTKYFATYNGSLLEQHPTSEPAYTDDDVIAFGDKLIRDAFQLDFKNYRTQISDQQQKFSETGFTSYYNALTSSNLFTKVITDKMIMSAKITRKGMIYRRGREGDTYMWDIQYPVTLSLDGQTRSLPPQNFIFTIRLQRTDVRVKPEGIEGASIVTRDAR